MSFTTTNRRNVAAAPTRISLDQSQRMPQTTLPNWSPNLTASQRAAMESRGCRVAQTMEFCGHSLQVCVWHGSLMWDTADVLEATESLIKGAGTVEGAKDIDGLLFRLDWSSPQTAKWVKWVVETVAPAFGADAARDLWKYERLAREFGTAKIAEGKQGK